MKKLISALSVTGLIFFVSLGASGLTIDEIQTSTGPDWESPYADQWVDITGGIVTKVYIGGRTRVIIQDPTLGDAWAGILISFDEHELATGITRGDQIDLTHVEIYESRGNTQAGFDSSSVFSIISSGNYVVPLTVSVADIPDPINADLSEKYEYMLLTVENVTVGAMDLGSHDDNYELFNDDGLCWAADYANYDLPPGSDYYVSAGEQYESITGYLEQYQNPADDWDYYQLLPRDAEDYLIGSSATLDTNWGNIKSMFR